MPESTSQIKLPGHIPLIWAVIPLVWGYALGTAATPSPIWLIPIALMFLGAAFALSSKARPFKATIWGTLFLLGATLLAWSWWIMREPEPPKLPLPPPREAIVTIKIDRLFGGIRRNGQISGLATITEGPKLLPDLPGQRCFFAVWPEDFQEEVATGAIFEAKGKLSALNPELDSEGFFAFLFRSGVYYSLETGQLMTLMEPAPAIEQWARTTNRSFRNTLTAGAETDSEKSLAGISEAMLLGRKEALQRSQKEIFIESGTMHLFAVSGLHIAVIAGALAFLFSRLRLPKRAGAILGLGLVFAYVMIVGHPPSAIRAFLMAVFFWSAVAFVRKPSSLSALLASAVLVLIWNPQEILRPGFQLSYAVVGGILLYGVPLANWSSERFRAYRYLPEHGLSRRQRIMATAWRWTLMTASVSLSATVFSAPLTVQYFGVFTPGAILLNMALVPLASVVIVIAASSVLVGMTGLTVLSIWINHLNWALIWILEKIVNLAIGVPGLFYPMQWRADSLATITVCSLFLGFSASMQLPRFRPWFFAIPPGLLTAFLVIGGKLVLPDSL
ncbi:ComEC/Rec2 family competence protein [Rubellicoccus peritrichatus]|uniref:ComEC/Rec2 family competence protein n=1 Tax=Rubellicoccus peritrichatus TaxID=3080537 RepID=A0AAQ3LG52_9BACT|nr:ComEC/Rec2 family competence protein [Puniceicoccus sp. CR14]WOO43213.1 ComEC/Rec2 family competence protein [Puniceicoccus sp. CR14]